MRKPLAALAALALLAGCGSTPNTPVDPLQEAFGAAFDVLTVYAAQGDIAQQGVDMLDALTTYSGEACAVLVDPALTPEERAFLLQTELAPERQAFDAALADLADIGGVNPAVYVLVNRARSIARQYAVADGVNAVRWERPCDLAIAFAKQWAERRLVVVG